MEGMNWNLPVLALRGLTVFPHMSLSLDVEREVSLRALEKAMEGDQRIFLVTQREIGTEAPEVCPTCNHPQSYFEVRKENY